MSAPPIRRRTTKPRPKPQTKTRTSKPLPKPLALKKPAKPVSYELIGVGLIALGIMLLLATHLPGGIASRLLICTQWLFGTYGVWGVGLALIILGTYLLINLSHMGLSLSVIGMSMIFWVTIGMLQLGLGTQWNTAHFASEPGGLFGSLLADGLFRLLGELAWVVLAAFELIGLSLLTHQPLWVVITFPFRAMYHAYNNATQSGRESYQLRREMERASKVAALQEEELQSRNRPLPEKEVPKPARDKVLTPKAEAPPPPKPEAKQPLSIFGARKPQPEEKPEPLLEDDFAPVPVVGVPSKDTPGQLQFDDGVLGCAPASNRRYNVPPSELLSMTPKKAEPTKNDTSEKSAALEETLASFGIEAKVVGVERGPRVTRFEIVPPPGIRINRITNLADNIALSLAALDVRVEAPVPGKGVVGIEVPNKDLVTVDLREIIESDAFRKSKSPLTFALGRDITGHPRCADLTKMPHLLIAGATNSGKSVCINSLLCSILMRATPQQVKLLLVDPKRVELSLFQSIPHLIAPVAYDAKHAAGLLRWAIREMEQRYETFAEKGVRNIAGFNENARLEKLEEVPYIVIIIDELADLMMQAAAEFEASICRIAQLARATGIHLVVATQRPSVNVITGTIKANIPSRIAFAVASQVDSRTILDMNGAERLVGQGDMLFLPVDASKPMRIQGAYVSEVDINRVVNHVRGQGKPQFTDEIVAIEEEAMRVDGDGSCVSSEPEDELYDKALDYIRTTKYASTSMLQRKFSIGYTRAARMMDIFEERGYVGPNQGSKPREVIFAPAASVVGRPADHRLDEGDAVGMLEDE